MYVSWISLDAKLQSFNKKRKTAGVYLQEIWQKTSFFLSNFGPLITK